MSIDELAENINIESIKKHELKAQAMLFEHTFNPLHYYSRLLELGIDRQYALKIAKKYEENTYLEVVDYLKDNN